MEEFLPTATLIGLIISAVNFVLYLRNKQWDNALKMAAAYAAGIGGALLAAQTDYADQFSFGGVSLAAANTFTVIFIGLSLGGSGTVVNEFKKAFDSNDSAKKPDLI
jgi:hypothetical protein